MMIRALLSFKRAALVAGLAAAVAIPSLAQVALGKGNSNMTMTSDADKLQQVERLWVRALEDGDGKLLERVVDANMSFIGPDGEYEEREAYLAGYRALPSMGVKVKKVDVDQMKIRVLGDTGVVTGHVVARIEVQANTVVENVRFTRVYQRRGDGWRMVAGQGTRITPAAPPPGPSPAAGSSPAR